MALLAGAWWILTDWLIKRSCILELLPLQPDCELSERQTFLSAPLPFILSIIKYLSIYSVPSPVLDTSKMHLCLQKACILGSGGGRRLLKHKETNSKSNCRLLFFFFKFCLFVCFKFWLHWVLIAAGDSLVVVPELSCPDYWDLIPWSGIEPASPALASRFLTTRQPRKSLTTDSEKCSGHKTIGATGKDD